MPNYSLTKREEEVLELMSKGFGNTQVADVLNISLTTVKTHVDNIYQKFCISCSADTQGATSALRVKAVLIYLKMKGKLKDE